MDRSVVALALLAVAFASPSAKGETQIVKVGGYTTSGAYYGGGIGIATNAYDPRNITINAGDSITFTNLGGAVTEPHNVHADDDSFRCSNGCRGDGSGATGDPAVNEWSSTM